MIAVAILVVVLAAPRIVAFVFAALPLLRARDNTPAPHGETAPWSVTVQVPLYNEPEVCVRAVDAACALEWQAPLLEIQILDDSDDERTPALVGPAVARWRARGVDAVHVRRPGRDGFKAGALAHGLTLAKGELVAVFDADFVPAPDFLRRALAALDDDVDLVQARWDHLNRDRSLFTRAQAALLDVHFAVEQTGRSAAGLFFGFNGTAGIWRRQAIAKAGGWRSTTLTEDLDLSVRARLAGCRFRYVDDVGAPAELPETASAWRVQQHRWQKGAAQTLRARVGDVWSCNSPTSSSSWMRNTLGKIDLTWKLAQGLLFVLLVALLISPAGDAGVIVTALFFASMVWALRRRGRPLGKALVDAGAGVALAVAMSAHAAVAVVAGLLGVGERRFVRTPKRGEGAMGPALRPEREIDDAVDANPWSAPRTGGSAEGRRGEAPRVSGMIGVCVELALAVACLTQASSSILSAIAGAAFLALATPSLLCRARSQTRALTLLLRAGFAAIALAPRRRRRR